MTLEADPSRQDEEPKGDAAPKGPRAAWPARADLKVLNHDLVRVDARAKVTGAARYTHDVRVEGLTYARLLLAPVPKLAITKLDLEPARKVKGVLGVVALETKGTNWLGQPIAAVAAETPEAAEDGLRAIVLAYEAKPWVVDAAQAAAPDAPAVRSKPPKPSSRGDLAKAEAALGNAAAVVDQTYTVPVQHHACLETHGVVVEYRGGDVATVWCSTQGTFTFAGDAAEILGLDEAKVEGRVDYMGGGFGSKFGLGAEGRAACLLSKEIRRPVHLMMTRRDEFLAAGNRSGGSAHVRLGASRDGKLVAMISDRRRYGGIGDGSMVGHPYIYAVEASHSTTMSVPMHLDSNRAMRAPGHPQGGFAMESALDELAYALGLDPLEFRKLNLESKVYHRQLDRVAREIGWFEHENRTKPGTARTGRAIGIGFAVATWGGGGAPGSECEVRIQPDGSVTSSTGVQDLGTGARTYVAAIAAEELGLRLEDVRAEIGNTRLPNAAASGGSVTTASVATAVKTASFDAARTFAEHLASVLGIDAARLAFRDGNVVDTQGEKPALAWKRACATLPPGGVRGRGGFDARLAGNGIHGAQAARVEVDCDTGRVRVIDMIAMQDCGLPLNRLAVVSQTNGGMIQALSYALLEERLVDSALGLQLNANFEAYKLAASLEMPRMRTILDDEDTRGVIGVAEATCIPGHSAIANAVFNACGARVRDLPLTPDKVLAALGKVT